mmetsp:Transcript_27481/g.82172  ORF Transcript_27481/g.82172 Transcript_27481/m.82172 type:complete len:97 (-) Transcript_27481:633-923(-)
MRSGVPDYDTVASRAWQLAHPTTDIDPLTILRQFVKPGFSCPPGTCGEYSSTNFVLLGMVLAGLKGRAVRRWEEPAVGCARLSERLQAITPKSHNP